MPRYQIDSDTAPPVIAATLTTARGQKMTASLTVPALYYAAAAPIAYAYIDGYGGRVENVQRSGDAVIITAYSKIGSTILDYARVNPDLTGQASTLQDWLAALCQLGSSSSLYSLDGDIAASAPYMHGLAVGSLLGLLTTICSCYGIDIYHVSTSAGDIIKFVHPGRGLSAIDLDAAVTALSYADRDAGYQQCVIVRTAPIEQHVEVPVSIERQTRLLKTSQAHPYLEAEVEYNPIGVYWDDNGRQVLFDRDAIALLDVPLAITDPEIQSDNVTYKDSLVYAPWFGRYYTEQIHTVTNTMTKGHFEGSQYVGDQYIDAVPGDGSPYKTITADTDYAASYYYGVYATDAAYAHYYLDWTLDDYDIDRTPQHGHASGHDEFDEYWTSDWPDIPYEFFAANMSEISSSSNAVYVWMGGAYVVKTSESGTSTRYVDTDPLYTPQRSDWPWLPTMRDTISNQTSSYTDSPTPGTTVTTKTQTLTASKALLDAGWDDVFKPPTIDEDIISLGDVSLDKSSDAAEWFDAEAAPAANRQFMGLGCVANYKYKLAISQEKIVLTPGHEPGRLTAIPANGATPAQYYNLQSGMSLNRIPTYGGVVHCTFLSSSQKSFTTAAGNNKGQSYTITGSVWRTKALALACIPYISRQHNSTAEMQATVPLANLPAADAMSLLGMMITLRSSSMYIISITIDYKTEMVSLVGMQFKD